MTCPFCTAELRAETHTTVEVDRCPRCTCLWFDRDELEVYVRKRDVAKARLDGAVLKAEGPPRDCPRCGTTSLHPCRIGKAAAYRCSSCGGIAMESYQLGHTDDAGARRAWVYAAPFGPEVLLLEELFDLIVGARDAK